MTEKFEIERLIEDAQEVVYELRYESNTKPGNGAEFARKLGDAAQLIDNAINIMKDALKMF